MRNISLSVSNYLLLKELLTISLAVSRDIGFFICIGIVYFMVVEIKSLSGIEMEVTRMVGSGNLDYYCFLFAYAFESLLA